MNAAVVEWLAKNYALLNLSANSHDEQFESMTEIQQFHMEVYARRGFKSTGSTW